MTKQQELEYIAKYNIKNGTHFYSLEQIANHASQTTKSAKQSAWQRVGSALAQSEGRSATEKAILSGEADAASKKLQEVGMDKESANQAVITPAYNTDKTTAALNTTLLTLLPDISAGLPGIIRLGTGALGGFAGNKGGKYLDNKLGTHFLQGIGSFVGGLAGYGFGNKAYAAYSLTRPLKLRTNYTGFTPRKDFSIKVQDWDSSPKISLHRNRNRTPWEEQTYVPDSYIGDFIGEGSEQQAYYNPFLNRVIKIPLFERTTQQEAERVALDFTKNRTISNMQTPTKHIGFAKIDNKYVPLLSQPKVNPFPGTEEELRTQVRNSLIKEGFIERSPGEFSNTVGELSLADLSKDNAGILNGKLSLFDVWSKKYNQIDQTSPNVINPRYFDSTGFNAENIVTDYMSGRQSAINFLGSEIKQAADKRNLELAKRIGYDKFDPNLTGNIRASVPMKEGINQNAVWLGDTNDGFCFTTKPIEDNAKAEIILRQNPSNDQLIITPFTNIDRTTFHEFLHRGNYGTSQNKSSSNDPWNIIRNFQTDNFYNWKTKHLLKNEIPTDDYLFKPGESATNFLETGIKEMGLSFGQPYPGKQDALNFYKKFLAGNSPKTFVLEKSKWETKPKRIWDALTGKYYTLPLIGAIGTREGLKND